MKLKTRKTLPSALRKVAPLVALLLAPACSGPDLTEFTQGELNLPTEDTPADTSERRPIQASLDVDGDDLVVSLRNNTREGGTVSLNANIDAPNGSYFNTKAAEVRIGAGEELRVVLPASELEGFDVDGHAWSRTRLNYEFTLESGRHGRQSTELAILAGQVVPRAEALESGRQLPDLVLDSDPEPLEKQASTFKACFNNTVDLRPRLSNGQPTACAIDVTDTGLGCIAQLDKLSQNRQRRPFSGQLYSYTSPTVPASPNVPPGSGYLDADGCTRPIARKAGNWAFRLYFLAGRVGQQADVHFTRDDGTIPDTSVPVTVAGSGDPLPVDVSVAFAERPWHAALFLANYTLDAINFQGGLPPGSLSLRIAPLAAGSAYYCSGSGSSDCPTARTLRVHQDYANDRGTIAHETGHFIHDSNLSVPAPSINYTYTLNPIDSCDARRSSSGHEESSIEWQMAAHEEGFADFVVARTYNAYGVSNGGDCWVPKYKPGTGVQVVLFDCEAPGYSLAPCFENQNAFLFGVTGNELDWTKMYWDYFSKKGGIVSEYMRAERAITSWPSATTGKYFDAIIAQLSANQQARLRMAAAGNIWSP